MDRPQVRYISQTVILQCTDETATLFPPLAKTLRSCGSLSENLFPVILPESCSLILFKCRCYHPIGIF
jgi:hypothetical protein